MRDAAKSRRFEDLRARELEGRLIEAERAELAALIWEPEDAEAALLAPALQRLRQENERLEMETARLAQQGQALTELLERREAYLARVRAMVMEMELESVDEFDREVAMLGQREKFVQFLAGRAKEPGTIPIEQLKQELEKQDECVGKSK